MKYKNIILLLLFQLAAVFVYAQNNVDTLLQMLRDHKKEDTTRLLIWATLAKEYTKVDIDKSLSSSDTVIRLARKLNLLGWEANAYNAKAAVYFSQGNYPEALAYIQKALTLAEQIGNKRRIFQSISNVAALNFEMGNYTKALEYFQKGIDISKQIDQKDGTANGLLGISSVYVELGNYPKALEYAQQALNIYEKIGEKPELRESYNILASIYTGLNNINKAINYSEKSLKIDEETGDQQATANDLNNLATVLQSSSNYLQAIEYRLRALKITETMGLGKEQFSTLVELSHDYAKLGDYSKALEYTKRAQKLNEKLGDISGGEDLINLGYIYGNAPASLIVANGFDSAFRYDKALEFLRKGLRIVTERKKLESQRDAWEYISAVYEKQSNHSAALEAYMHFIKLRDSVLNNEKRKEITRLEIQYEFNKKEDSLNLQQQITSGKLKQQEQQLTLNKNQLTISNKEKDLQRLAYLKTQADLQNEQLQKREKEKQLTLAEKEKQLQSVQVTTLSQENDLSKLRRRQQWVYSIAAFVLLGLLVSYLFYNNRIKQGKLRMELAKEKAEQEKKEAEFQRSLADVSLTALRSQMNPHFIFNCLNSIKLYTTQNETAAASEYLTKFSRLIRLVMENSRNDRITLTAELDALRLYIEMEAMRFKEKLSYNISVDKDVEMDYVEIPPLLLQPYVENAIWHGLMHKEEGGRIDVTAAMKKNESLLEINIADNGVGRAKAEELRSKTATRHKSYGMKVTSERIALINQIYKTGANVAIYDVTNDNGEVAGTRVVIQIPV
ncbi:MAG: tetratricopeptide repeat protein [Chitinophagaceae bacterium]